MTKKFFFIFLAIALFITFNSSLFKIKIAEAVVDPTGAIVSPVNPPGEGAPVFVTNDVNRDVIDRVGIVFWKAAVYPVMRDALISIITTGDFKLSWVGIKDWLIHDLAFQTANAFLKEYIGFDLCTTIGADVRFALGQMYLDDSFQPSCTFDQSQLAKTTEKLFTGESEQAWQDVKNYYYKNFHFSLYGEDNQFGTWFKLRDNINTQIDKRQQNIRFEMLINEGFLGNYDCTGVPEDRRPTDCRVLTPGMAIAQLVKGSVRDPMDSALKAQMVSDLANLLGVATDVLKNKFIYSMYNNF